MALAPAIERSSVNFDTYDVLQQGLARVPIAGRKDSDFHHVPRDVIAKRNAGIDYALPNFFGISQFPEGTEPVSDLFALKDGMVMTIRQPAPYFGEAVLVVGTNITLPVPAHLTEMPTVVVADLKEHARTVFHAHQLAALRTADDSARWRKAKAVAIVHHSPLTTETNPLPRSGPPAHSTVGLMRDSDLVRTTSPAEHPRLTAERALVSPLTHTMAEQMQHALADQGIKPDEVQVMPRVKKPTGVAFHIFDLTRQNLISPEGVRDAVVVFDAIHNAHKEVYPKLFGSLPEQIEHDGIMFQTLQEDAHRQILHMYKNHAVYGYSPLVIGTHVGSVLASGLTIDRSVDYVPTVRQQRRAAAFNRKVGKRVHAVSAKLGYDSYRVK